MVVLLPAVIIVLLLSAEVLLSPALPLQLLAILLITLILTTSFTGYLLPAGRLVLPGLQTLPVHSAVMLFTHHLLGVMPTVSTREVQTLFTKTMLPNLSCSFPLQGLGTALMVL
jgi:ABC-type microcin C transport system permease subunit YejB